MRSELPERIASMAREERGVFVPGLMGAGILLSIVMLVSDGLRRVLPVRGERARAVRAEIAAVGRARDLLAVERGRPPRPHRVRQVPRERGPSLVLGALSTTVAVTVGRVTLTIFESRTGVLADRGWTLGFGYSAAALFGLAGLVWLASAALGSTRPPWLDRLARWGPLGTDPDAGELEDPLFPARLGRPPATIEEDS